MANTLFAPYTNRIQDGQTAKAVKDLLDAIDNGDVDLTDPDMTAATITTLTSTTGNITTVACTTLTHNSNTILDSLQQNTVAGKSLYTGLDNLDATKFSIATGLGTIDNVFVSIKSTTAPLNVVAVSWTATAGALSLYGWKFKSASSSTLVAATATASIKFTAIGNAA